MTRDEYLKSHLPESLKEPAVGQIVNELSIDEFEKVYKRIFDSIMEIHQADVSDTTGYGEFTTEGELPYKTFKDFIVHTFDEDRKGYWKNWKKLFEGKLLDKKIFETYYKKMMHYSEYCENQRFLTNGFVYFDYMTITPETVGFLAWDRAGIYDWFVDFATFDSNKPYLFIPEKLYAYMKEKNMNTTHFKERFLCMAYFRGIDGLRWHASIDDEASCKGILNHLSTLEERILNLE